MKTSLIYISPNGTTRILTDIMSEILSKLGTVTVFDLGRGDLRNSDSTNPNIFGNYDLLGIGGPTYHLRVFKPITNFIQTILSKVPENGSKRSAFVYTTYAGILSGRTLINMAKDLHRANYTTLAVLKIKMPHFRHSFKNLPGEHARSLLEKLPDILLERIANPPEWKKIHKLLSYQRPFARLIYPFTRITGRINKVDINLDANLCKKCGLCVKECPVSALTIEPY